MGVNAPTSNKIHLLPVLVNYHIPTSPACFTSLFPVKQQVYIHANGTSKKSVGVEDDRWGSIPLKTVVQGVMLASPELHPFESSTPDRSLYVLDTRETILRRQRSSIPSHLRSDRASSPIASPSVQSQSSISSGEVWSGKGLISWALKEPGDGKTLITGRLVKSAEFTSVVTESEGLGALEALMMSDQEDGCWGLEVNISLRPQGMPMTGPLVAPLPNRERLSSVVSDASEALTPARTARTQAPRSTARPGILDQTPGASSSTTKKPRAPNGTGTKKRKSSSPNKNDRILASIPINIDQLEDVPSIPAALYANPASLSQEQLARLLASPAFQDLLEKAGNQGTAAKRLKHDQADGCVDPICYNCGRTKSSVWRSRVIDGGKEVRVCNACGLYYNQKKTMRPPSLWGGVDDDISERSRVNPPKAIIPRNPPQAPPIITARAAAAAAKAKAKEGSSPSTNAPFRRTLSAAVDEDAKRLASRRSSAPGKSNLNPNRILHPPTSPAQNTRAKTMPQPATSPAQSTRAKTMRNASWKNAAGEAASSPGGFVDPTARAVKAHEAFEPLSTIRESPRSQANIQSLQLPLSDDQIGHYWDTDISTLFDIDAFEQSISSEPQQTLRRSPRKHHRTQSQDDDPLSHLFSGPSATPKSNFDFSALPPSSPPFPGQHGMSGLLMSSPDFSPMSSMFGPSPVENGGMLRVTPEKNKSGLRNSFTPIQEGREEPNPFAPQDGNTDIPVMSLDEITQALNESGMDQAAWDELFGLMSEVEAGAGAGQPSQDQGQVQGNEQAAAGMDMGDEWSALFNTLSQ